MIPMIPKFEVVSNPEFTIQQAKAKFCTPEGCLFVWDEHVREHPEKVDSLLAEQVQAV